MLDGAAAEPPLTAPITKEKLVGKPAASAAVPVKTEPEKARPAQGGAAGGRLDKAALSMLRKAVEASADEDGRANLARVGAHLAKQSPDFDARNYGYARLSDLAEASGILDVERAGDQPKVVLVRLRMS